MFIIFMFTVLSLVLSQRLNPDSAGDLFGTVGFFVGMNVAYILMLRRRVPEDTGSTKQRATRAFIALLLFELSKITLETCFCKSLQKGLYETAGITNYLHFACQQFALIEFLKPLFLYLQSGFP